MNSRYDFQIKRVDCFVSVVSVLVTKIFNQLNMMFGFGISGDFIWLKHHCPFHPFADRKGRFQRTHVRTQVEL